MPNRILRNWCNSHRVNQLSYGAECFFTRLIMTVDDFGRYHATAKSLNGAMYPLRDDIKIRTIYGWLEECAAAGLIQFYTAKGRDYLVITDFNQRLRSMKSQFPDPDLGQEMTAKPPPFGGQTAGRPRAIRRPETKRNETRNEARTENDCHDARMMPAPIGTGAPVLWPSFDDFWDAYGKRVGRAKCEAIWKKIKQGGREKIMAHLQSYIPATPELRFRKDPATYLRNESWNDEIIETKNKHGKQTNITDALLAGIAARANSDDDGPAL